MAEIKSISEIIEEISPYYRKLKEKKLEGVPAEEHKIIYDSTAETLEPVYFWIVDFMNDMFKKVEKLVDNFVSSPGSGHFAELGARATKMQEEAMKIMQTIGILVKSLVNIVYDLREFEIRLKHYDALHSKDEKEREAALLALKQIWMDNVDIKRGRGSINMLAQDLNFVTIRDAFMAVKSLEEVDKLDLNDRVKRILKARVKEFFDWLELSEKELRKRYEIERSYLKSQVNALRLYTRWAKPYLRAAAQLEMKEAGREPALVKAFSTILLELTLLGRSPIDVEQAIIDGDLPEAFRRIKFDRNYYSCVLVDFNFRGIPYRTPQGHYTFGGRVEVTFKAYALNDDELMLLDEKLKETELEEALKLVEGMTTESLEQLREDIEYFLKEPEKRELEEEKNKSQDVNPFAALFGFYNRNKKPEKKKDDKTKKIEELKEEGVRPDNHAESLLRKLAESGAKDKCFTIFDVYKKAHGMASHPAPE